MNASDTPRSSDVADNYSVSVPEKPALTSANEDTAPHSDAQQRQRQGSQPDTAAASTVHNKSMKTTFADIPPELREMIWEYALPDSRVFNALVYASAGLKMQLLERSGLRIPIAHVCYESRQVVLKAGYRLAFRDEDEPDDPGVFFHPRKDVIERTLWGPGDFWGLK
ncbi:hypothetical protein F4781DRAFT_199044 [Annulohypoxylon bovei var. microspora]|nr:hypothetical protein F4781DRAFT_199044 [Annulohypoxylon bovei var. microspora]